MVDLIWFNSGYELPTFSWKAWGSDVYMKISWNGGTPKIIQVMDDWMTTLVLKTMVTWGSPHFEKTPKRCSSLRAKRKQPRASAQACRLFDAPCQLYQAERPNLPLKKGVYPNTWPWKTLKNWGNWCFNPMELGVPFFSNKPSCFFPFVWQKAWFPAELSLDRSTGCQHVDDFELPASALSFSKGDCGSSCNGVATLGNWTNELSPTNSAGCFDYMGSEKMIAASKMT